MVNAEIQNLLPSQLVNKLDTMANDICKLNPELRDEATSYLVGKVQQRTAEHKGHFLFGHKYICDLLEHIGKANANSLYKVVRN